MFGLLKNPTCKDESRLTFEKNYCGTCKTIGKLYGHKERLFLCNDIVFLSELISEINNKPDEFNNITTRKCFQLPSSEASIPDFLKYAASLNVILGYYKLRDNENDSSSLINVWKQLRRIEEPTYKLAARRLSELGLDINFIDNCIQEQHIRESSNLNTTEFSNTFLFYSEMTVNITGASFKQGANLIRLPELATVFQMVGESFGKVVYLTDAIIDYKDDVKTGSFNFLKLESQKPFLERRTEIISHIYNLLDVINKNLDLLPISSTAKWRFTERLKLSVNRKLIDIKFSKEHTWTISQKFKTAIKLARIKSVQQNNIFQRRVVFYSVALILILTAVTFPSILHAMASQSEISSGPCETICSCGCDCPFCVLCGDICGKPIDQNNTRHGIGTCEGCFKLIGGCMVIGCCASCHQSCCGDGCCFDDCK